jgi:hypothetical protein
MAIVEDAGAIAEAAEAIWRKKRATKRHDGTEPERATACCHGPKLRIGGPL